MTIEEKLRNLAECGLTLRRPFGIPDLVKSWGREALDGPDYDLALVCLGMTDEERPWSPHCENLWHFDAECIDDRGSYVRIALRMAEMATGSLPISDLEDHVDIDGQSAWLRFRCRGKPVHIDCEVDNDWVDPQVFGHFVQLLAECDPHKLFIYYDLGGQDCIIGCVTREQYQNILKVVPAMKPLS